MKDKSLRVLMVEDSEDDAVLTIRELKKGGYDPAYEMVETAAAMQKALKDKQWDIILCDYSLPKLNAPSAIALLKKANIGIPIIIVSRTISEDVAAECMRLGAHDYVMKDNLSRLCPAIARELDEVEVKKQQKDTEEKLRHEEQRFRTFVENSPDIIAILDRKGIITYENKALERCLGLKIEERLGGSIFDRIHPDDLKLARDAFSKFTLNTSSQDINSPVRQIRLRHQDGSWRTFETSASKLLDDNIVESVIISLRDITERKRTETELLKTTTMLESLLDAIPDVIGVQDMGHGIIRYNAAGYALLGQTPEGIAGKKCFEIIGHETPCDICATSETYRTKQTATKEKFVPELGTWLEVRSYPVIDANGEIRFVIEHLRDITDRKRAEEALRDSEELYRTIFENTGTSMILIEEDMTISMANEEFLRNTGYSADEINGRIKWTEIVHQDDLGRMIEQHLLRRVTQGDALPSYEFRYITKTGDVRDAFLTIQVVPGTKKSIASLIDITERKKSENLLRASEDKFFNIFNLSPVLIAISDLQDGTYIDINDNFLNVLGYDRREVVGKSSEELGIIVESQKRSEALEILLKDGLFLDFEIPIRKKNGKICIGLFSGTVINLQGRQVLLTIMNDITERQLAESQKEAALDALRKSEDKYRTLIETTDTGYVIIDQDGLVRDANSEYVRLTGHHDLSEIVGRSVMEWTAESEKEKNAEAVKACFEKGYIRNLEIDYVDAKGNITPIEINATCIEIEGKTHTITICRDITDRKQAERSTAGERRALPHDIRDYRHFDDSH